MEQPKPPSVEEFLAWEALQPEKHEFSEGQVFAFAGALNRHNFIASAVISALFTAVGDRCIVGGSDTKVVGADWSRYPDVVVSCDERERLDIPVLEFPKLIVEVLSESTHMVDREEKLDQYRTLDSLEEYVMIDSRRRWSQAVTRSGGSWIISIPQTAGTLRFSSVDAALDLDALYARVRL